MQTTFSCRARCRFWQGVLFGILFFLAAPVLHAGLSMEMDLVLGNYATDFYGNNNYYYAFFPNLTTNSASPAVPFGDYFVASPGWPTNGAAALYQYDTNGFNQVGGGNFAFGVYDAPDYNDSFIQNITNGQWTISVTNTVETNVYYFTVTANITSNSISPVVVLYPPNTALDVTNQPTFVWEGPTNYSDLVLYGGSDNAELPATQTSYNGFILPVGLNSFTVHYDLYSTTDVVSSVPTNSASQPLSSWVSTTHIQDISGSQFTVGSIAADFNAALDTTNLPWATFGDASWTIETTNTYDGAPSAAQSGSVTGSQSSTLSVTVTGPGTLTFYWSSIANDPDLGFDYQFDIDGTDMDDIVGDNPWYQEVNQNTGLPYVIPPGQHTLTWTVSANGDTDPTQAGFLAQVSYVQPSSPVLVVTNSPTNGLAPLTVQFTSPMVDSAGNTVTNWNWSFGDGGGSTAQSPAYTYTNAGSYSPSLTAYSTYGATPLTVTGLGTITVTNLTLNVTATPQSGLAPLTVQFYSPGVDSAGNLVTNWNWTFGDGGASTAQNPTHVYPSLGSFFPSLTAYSTSGTSPLAVAGLGVIIVSTNPVPAFHTLYTFSTVFGTGPNADLALSGNTLYGTTGHGGTNGLGVLFAINTDGSGFTNLSNFSSAGGGEPVGGLIVSGSTLYGPTDQGGGNGSGTVFAINTNGTGHTNLLNLSASSGYEPLTALALSGNLLYGSTWYSGIGNEGTLFFVSTDGATNGVLHTFATPYYNADSYAINYDGIFPSARLLNVAGTLYGTTEQAGENGSGTIFSVITNQPDSFSIVHYFAAVDPVTLTNNEGAFSFAGLVLSGTNLYGTAIAGGVHGNGTVFAASTNGLFFTNLYSFTGGNDGSEPHAGVTLSGNTLYGTTLYGGTSGQGTLFAIHTDGSGFTNLYNFTGGGDGANPQTDLILSGNTLYGTTASGGSAGDGTVFSFTLPLPPLLAIARSGTNVILTWSANLSGYTLESATNLVPTAVWITNPPAPVVINGLNTVTNAVGPFTKFYRLSQ